MKKKSNEEKEKRPSKKRIPKWVKPVVIVLVLAVGAGVLFYLNNSKVKGYTEETVQLRDIKTYHSFSGNIEPVKDESVFAPTAMVKINKIGVAEGDQVKAGDVLMNLDTDDLEESIKELKATMALSEKTSGLSLKSAQKTYDDYKTNLGDHLNSAVIGAKQILDNDYAALVTAQRTFNNEVKLNNNGLSTTILTSINSVDTAYDQVRNAEAADNMASTDVTDAAATSAWSGYNDAVNGFEAAKQNEENQLTGYYDQIITAQTNYLDALDSYNSALRTADQTMATYALQVESARAATDDNANKLKLANLQKQVKDCTVTAPIDGVVTSLPVKEGDMTVTGSSVATITNFDKMKVDIKINEYDILGVENGKKVNIAVDALNKIYEGSITKVAKVATVDNGVSYFKSEVDFAADQDTRSGMSVEVKLPINNLNKVPTVSSDAVTTDTDGSTYVMVYAKNKKEAVKQKITCGATDGTYTQVTEGLKEGQVILRSLTAGTSDTMTGSRMRSGNSSSNGSSSNGSSSDGNSSNGNSNNSNNTSKGTQSE